MRVAWVTERPSVRSSSKVAPLRLTRPPGAIGWAGPGGAGTACGGGASTGAAAGGCHWGGGSGGGGGGRVPGRGGGGGGRGGGGGGGGGGRWGRGGALCAPLSPRFGLAELGGFGARRVALLGRGLVVGGAVWGLFDRVAALLRLAVQLRLRGLRRGAGGRGPGAGPRHAAGLLGR